MFVSKVIDQDWQRDDESRRESSESLGLERGSARDFGQGNDTGSSRIGQVGRVNQSYIPCTVDCELDECPSLVTESRASQPCRFVRCSLSLTRIGNQD